MKYPPFSPDPTPILIPKWQYARMNEHLATVENPDILHESNMSCRLIKFGVRHMSKAAFTPLTAHHPPAYAPPWWKETRWKQLSAILFHNHEYECSFRFMLHEYDKEVLSSIR